MIEGQTPHSPAKDWRLNDQRYRLIGDICACGNQCFPPHGVCTACNHKSQARTQSDSLARIKLNLDLKQGTFEFNPEFTEGSGYVGALIHLLRKNVATINSALASLSDLRRGFSLSKLLESQAPPHQTS